MKTKPIIFILFLSVLLGGCSPLAETVKVLWGSSTQALEEARPGAVKTTFRATVDQCFEVVAGLPKEKKLTETPSEGAAAPVKEKNLLGSPAEPEAKNHLNVFIRDRRKQLIVLMGIPASVNTTEVGVFFSSAGKDTTRVEVVSLSPKAQLTASEIIFKRLAQDFPEVK